MTLSNFLNSLARRWHLLLGALTLTASLCLLAYSAVPPTYERAASVLLLPGTQTIPTGGNPYLYLAGLGQARNGRQEWTGAGGDNDVARGERAGFAIGQRDFHAPRAGDARMALHHFHPKPGVALN